GGAGGDGAVRGERRAQLAQRLRGGVRADALVLRNGDRLTLAPRHLHRRDLVGEGAVLLGRGGPLVAGGGVGVLLGPADAQPGAVPLGGLPHGALVPDVGQPVERQVVAEHHVAVLVAAPL